MRIRTALIDSFSAVAIVRESLPDLAEPLLRWRIKFTQQIPDCQSGSASEPNYLQSLGNGIPTRRRGGRESAPASDPSPLDDRSSTSIRTALCW